MTAGSRDGLFWSAPGAEAAAVVDNPLSRPCPHCGSPKGERCTSASRRVGGRRILREHFHDSRTHRPQETQDA